MIKCLSLIRYMIQPRFKSIVFLRPLLLALNNYLCHVHVKDLTNLLIATKFWSFYIKVVFDCEGTLLSFLFLSLNGSYNAPCNVFLTSLIFIDNFLDFSCNWSEIAWIDSYVTLVETSRVLDYVYLKKGSTITDIAPI